MTKRYASFLLRWWHHGVSSELVEIERIQTGERVLFGSLADAFDWVAAHGPGGTRSSPPAAVPSPLSITQSGTESLGHAIKQRG